MSDVCLLPGPVAMSARVRAALQQPPLYHRGAEFLTLFESVRCQLAALTGAREVALFLGSGTLANDIVAATLAATASRGRGVILENGEFGRRLVGQAERFGLAPRVLSWPWGTPWDPDAIAAMLDDVPPESWVWGVHHETSTGLLNDLPALVRVARQRGVRVCVDAISSLGGMPLDLSEVFLASGTSGKALGASSGIAIVFANLAQIGKPDQTRVPTYLDLVAALAHKGPRFTFTSSALQGLAAALVEYATPEQARDRYEHYASLGRWIRSELRRQGLPPLADESCAGSIVATFAPPKGSSSEAFVDHCRRGGYLIGGQSEYLAERRLVQIATMGDVTRVDCTSLFRHLAATSRREKRRDAS